jgi:hypothetical protein
MADDQIGVPLFSELYSTIEGPIASRGKVRRQHNALWGFDRHV